MGDGCILRTTTQQQQYQQQQQGRGIRDGGMWVCVLLAVGRNNHGGTNAIKQVQQGPAEKGNMGVVA